MYYQLDTPLPGQLCALRILVAFLPAQDALAEVREFATSRLERHMPGTYFFRAGNWLKDPSDYVDRAIKRIFHALTAEDTPAAFEALLGLEREWLRRHPSASETQ